MNIIEGDIIAVVAKQGGVLVHQVNCQHVAGNGLALQVRKRWPDWWQVYRKRDAVLGDAYMQLVDCLPTVQVASLYGQDGYGTDKRYTDYDALANALKLLAPVVKDMTVYVPLGMGCGLAGGEWKIVLPLLEKFLPHATLVELPANPDVGKISSSRHSIGTLDPNRSK